MVWSLIFIVEIRSGDSPPGWPAAPWLALSPRSLVAILIRIVLVFRESSAIESRNVIDVNRNVIDVIQSATLRKSVIMRGQMFIERHQDNDGRP
jgi:hypothetical protein